MNTIDDLCAHLDRASVSYKRTGSVIKTGGDLDLRSLTTLPEGVTLSAGGYLDLRNLTTLPEGVTLSAGGSLYLRNLTTLPEGVTLSAGGYLDLRNLTTEGQRYQGRAIKLRTIDGMTMRLIACRDLGDEIALWSAQYFKGNLETDPRCFVAQRGAFSAHGQSSQQALRDLRFKIAQANFDAGDLVQEIKARGSVRFNDYRLLTGACEAGLRQGLADRGLDPDTDELPLAQALELCRGAFGGEEFRRLMTSAS